MAVTRSMAQLDPNFSHDRLAPKKRKISDERKKRAEQRKKEQKEARQKLLEQKREEKVISKEGCLEQKGKEISEEVSLEHFGAVHVAGVKKCQQTMDETVQDFLTRANDVEAFLSIADLPESVIGEIEAFCGKARLLVSSKLQKQYQRMLKDALDPAYTPPTKVSDLTGFWEMVEIQIEEVRSSYDALLKLRDNNWKQLETKPVPTKVLKPKMSNKPAISTAIKTKNLEIAKARAEKMKAFKAQMKEKLQAQKDENTLP